MKTKVKKVMYLYCDFCGKRMQRVDAMNHHESRCTLNPDRKCGMCGTNWDYRAKAQEFSAALAVQPDKALLLDWFKHCISCPACILTVLRLSGQANNFIGIFQFKEEMEKWNEVRANEDPRW